MSPYIKLDAQYKELFDKQRHNNELHILLTFGKNERRVDKSFNQSDLEYFKQFPNISIIYVPKLHAKYYGNEKMGIVTSINLYDYSFDNNIEFGVLYESSGFSLFNKHSDAEVWNACKAIANTDTVVYINRPMYENYNYRGSKMLFDTTTELYGSKPLLKSAQKYDEFEDELDYDKVYSEMPTRQISSRPEAPVYRQTRPVPNNSFSPGYCIRTGEKIPFNVKSPFSKPAYQSWSKYKKEDYAERYCHYSGEPPDGETSFKKPILAKNWKKASAL